jgi:hypothetical protein
MINERNKLFQLLSIQISCSVPSLTDRRVCIARLLHPTNLGVTTHDIRFFILIVAPTKQVIKNISHRMD